MLGRQARSADLLGFLARADAYRQPAATDGAAGREQAADVIEGVLYGRRVRCAA